VEKKGTGGDRTVRNFMFCAPHPTFSIEKFKKKGMGGACGTSGEKRDAHSVLCGNMKEGDHLKYLGVGWRMV
jgi:hypothetical protein